MKKFFCIAVVFAIFMVLGSTIVVAENRNVFNDSIEKNSNENALLVDSSHVDTSYFKAFFVERNQPFIFIKTLTKNYYHSSPSFEIHHDGFIPIHREAVFCEQETKPYIYLPASLYSISQREIDSLMKGGTIGRDSPAGFYPWRAISFKTKYFLKEKKRSFSDFKYEIKKKTEEERAIQIPIYIIFSLFFVLLYFGIHYHMNYKCRKEKRYSEKNVNIKPNPKDLFYGFAMLVLFFIVIAVFFVNLWIWINIPNLLIFFIFLFFIFIKWRKEKKRKRNLF